MSTDVRLYLTLAAVVALYAILLHHTKNALEPDFTIVEVIVGCTICLGFAAWRQRITGDPGWQGYERSTWLAFLVGGVIIGIWQIGRAVWRQEELRRRGRTDTATMAKERRGSARGDD